MAELKKAPGFVDLDTSYRGGKPELSFDIDRERAAELGVPVAAIATTLRALVAGDKVTELKEGLDIYDVTVQLPAGGQDAGSPRSSNLTVRGSTGQLVAAVQRGAGDPRRGPQPDRAPGPPAPDHRASPTWRACRWARRMKVVNGAAAKVVPDHLDTDFAGMGEIMDESSGYMGIALILAVVLVYMILAAQFNSFVHPFTIMLSLPLSVVGAFGALYLARHDPQHLLDDRRHHADGPGDQERHPAGRLHQPPARRRASPPSRRCWRPARSGCAPSS